MLTEFFTYCLNDPNKEPYLYGDFLEKFMWHGQYPIWYPRGNKKKVIGHINAANVCEWEMYYLRLFLTHVRSPTSFEDLKDFDGVRCNAFKEAALARRLLQSIDWVYNCLSDALTFQMPNALRCPFATILVLINIWISWGRVWLIIIFRHWKLMCLLLDYFEDFCVIRLWITRFKNT